MPTIYVAYTSRINPAGASPVLTRPQVWTGLQRKIRHAEEFVPLISSCKVLSDEAGVVRRQVEFKSFGASDSRVAIEDVKSFAPSWVDFVQEDGTVIRNIVSEGPSGELEDLSMTYMFEFQRPRLEEGSAELAKEVAHLKAMSKVAVESSIKTIRDMVKDERIEA